MAVVFCCPFDTDLIACVPGITPTSGVGVIDNSIYKFGGGSLTDVNPRILWDISEDMPGDQGTFGAWYRFETGIQIITTLWGAGETLPGRITVVVTATPINSIFLQMHNASGTGVLSQTISGLTIAKNAWYYIEVDWLWNNASGKTEVFLNGSSIWSSAAGNSHTRDGSAGYQYQAGRDIDVGEFIDDVTFFDTRLHTGNFANPTAAQCACPVAGIFLNLGAPFGGGMNRMGR